MEGRVGVGEEVVVRGDKATVRRDLSVYLVSFEGGDTAKVAPLTMTLPRTLA